MNDGSCALLTARHLTDGENIVKNLPEIVRFKRDNATRPRQNPYSLSHLGDRTAHSVITVRVLKSGLFSAFGDNHEIRAPISSGFLDQAGNRVELVVDSRKLVVLDPNLAVEKRQQVQERMLGPEVLDSNQFHEIRFEGNNVKQEAPADRFLVAGTLWLHGKTGPISLHVTRSNGHYRGETVLKQRDFGITPVSVAGGTVKVKDELKIEFDIGAVSASYRAATEP